MMMMMMMINTQMPLRETPQLSVPLEYSHRPDDSIHGAHAILSYFYPPMVPLSGSSLRPVVMCSLHIVMGFVLS